MCFLPGTFGLGYKSVSSASSSQFSTAHRLLQSTAATRPRIVVPLLPHRRAAAAASSLRSTGSVRPRRWLSSARTSPRQPGRRGRRLRRPPRANLVIVVELLDLSGGRAVLDRRRRPSTTPRADSPPPPRRPFTMQHAGHPTTTPAPSYAPRADSPPPPRRAAPSCSPSTSGAADLPIDVSNNGAAAASCIFIFLLIIICNV